jgi:hypothetical protein
MLVSLNIIAALGLFMIVGGTYATAELIRKLTLPVTWVSYIPNFQHPFITRNRDCLKTLVLGATV